MPRARRIYDHPAWQVARLATLERDRYRCQIKGTKCLGTANEADHIVPLVEGGAPFDPDNLRAACKPCNAGRTSKRKAEEGWRSSSTRIILVAGPPAAGKTTYVEQHRGDGDVVIDFDLIAEAVGSRQGHDHAGAFTDAARVARGALLRQVRRGGIHADVVWLVSANPRAVEMFPHHEARVIDPGYEQVVAQARAAGRPAQWFQLIDEWYGHRSQAPRASRDW